MTGAWPLLVHDPQALVQDLQDLLPRASLIGGDADFEALVARAVGLGARCDSAGAAILIGDDRIALQRELAQAFPQARLVTEATRLDTTVTKIVAFLEAPQNGLDLPLDIRGSALQPRRMARSGFRWGVRASGS